MLQKPEENMKDRYNREEGSQMKRKYAKQDYELPDQMISLSEMHEYGYIWEEMLPLTQEKAKELFEHNLLVYLLYNDGSETIVEDINQITAHDGIFGVEKRNWVPAAFRAKTDKMFHNIDGFKPAEIEEIIKSYIQEKIDEYTINATIMNVVISGSRCRGMEHEDSDLDVVVELSTNEKEDYLFNIFNEDGFCLGLSKDIKVDINPITARETGSLENYLQQVENYLEMLTVKTGRGR